MERMASRDYQHSHSLSQNATPLPGTCPQVGLTKKDPCIVDPQSCAHGALWPLPANGAAGTKVISVAQMSCAHKYVLGSFTYKQSKFKEKLLRNFTMATAEHGTNHRPHTREVSPALSGKITVWSQFCFENHPPTHTHTYFQTQASVLAHIYTHMNTQTCLKDPKDTHRNINISYLQVLWMVSIFCLVLCCVFYSKHALYLQ